MAVWLARPARKQSSIDPRKLQTMEGAGEFNIWYGRYSNQGRGAMGYGKEPAPTRCVTETDAGYTRGDSATLERPFFCIYFARGHCSRGAECTFFHRIPTAEDDGKLDVSRDVFGRERFASHRDDMGGVGSFEADCRTLYVGNIRKTGVADPGGMVRKHFEEWGEIENINWINRLSIAFVRYRCRSSTEFAREAMTNQALDSGEVLNVRWAYDDPNPVAKESIKRANADAALAALLAKGYSLVQPAREEAVEEVYADGQLMDAAAVADAEGGVIAAYPNADAPAAQPEVPPELAPPPKLASYAYVPDASAAAAPGTAGADAAAFLTELAVEQDTAAQGTFAAMGIPPPPANQATPEYAAWYYTYYAPMAAAAAAATTGSAASAAAHAGQRRGREEEVAADVNGEGVDAGAVKRARNEAGGAAEEAAAEPGT